MSVGKNFWPMLVRKLTVPVTESGKERSYQFWKNYNPLILLLTLSWCNHWQEKASRCWTNNLSWSPFCLQHVRNVETRCRVETKQVKLPKWRYVLNSQFDLLVLVVRHLNLGGIGPFYARTLGRSVRHPKPRVAHIVDQILALGAQRTAVVQETETAVRVPGVETLRARLIGLATVHQDLRQSVLGHHIDMLLGAIEQHVGENCGIFINYNVGILDLAREDKVRSESFHPKLPKFQKVQH
jgi:hypothetical protein